VRGHRLTLQGNLYTVKPLDEDEDIDFMFHRFIKGASLAALAFFATYWIVSLRLRRNSAAKPWAGSQWS
jgi:hypothetical protein